MKKLIKALYSKDPKLAKKVEKVLSEENLCPFCKSNIGKCSKCGAIYNHGSECTCNKSSCKESPITCDCGRNISMDRKGIMGFDGNFYRWGHRWGYLYRWYR